MTSILIVGLGGFIGTVFRYLLGLIPVQIDFPIVTLIINFTGAFLIGAVYSFSENSNVNPKLTLFFKTGICGGFTTFSTFSLETFNLIENKKFLTAGIYSVSSVILCLLGVWLGSLTAKQIKALI